MMAFFAILVIVFLFGLTVFVHELGHFLIARWCGMKVDVFSIGFGPSIWKRVHNGITYKIGALPLGGYVALPQMNPSDLETGAEKPTDALPDTPFPPAPPWKRILVSFAGAAGNVVLAILLAWGVFFAGKPSAPHERQCIIGYVEPGTEAWEAGLRTGDTVTSAQGEPVRNWQDFLTLLALGGEDETALLQVRSPGDERPREIELHTEPGRMGLRLPGGVAMEELCRVGALAPGGSAEQAGLKPGDLILELDGIRIFSRPHLIDLVEARADQKVPILIRRDGEERTFRVRPTPDPESDRVLIGIVFSQIPVDFDAVVHPRPGAQIREHSTLILRILRALVTPKETRSAAGAIGGPVAIFYHLWLVRNSLMLGISFTVLLNVNLAIINLLPIPILDGGHILFAFFEVVFRRPVPPVAIEWLHRVFASLLIAVFLLLIFRDTLRLFF